jgi:outer membrane receptor for ferrienterochelin and colicin
LDARCARRATVWLALGALLFASVVAADQQPGFVGNPPPAVKEDVFPLPEIVVQGKRIEAPPSLILRKVTEADIEARNAHTVGEALIYVPGVNVQIGGTSGDARAWIRGYRDRDVLVLFDGIPIASGFEGTIDLKEVSVQRVSAINVMKSAPSVIYGTNGVGGVIDILPNMIVDGLFLDGRAELGTDQRRYFRASGGAGGETLGFALSAQYRSADEYSLSADYPGETNQPPGDRVNSDFNQGSLFLQFEARNTVIGRTSMFVSLADAQKGLAVETGIDDPDYERLTKSKRRTLGLSNQFSELPLSLKLWYNGYESELTAYTDDRFSEIDEVESNEDYSYGGKLFSSLETSSSNTLILSAGAQSEVFKGEGELEEGNKAELTTWTLAAEDQFWISRRLSLVAGGIFVYFDQTRLNRSTSEFNPHPLPQASRAVPAALRQSRSGPADRGKLRGRLGLPPR